MSNPFILKLEHGAELDDEDRRVLERAVAKVGRIGADEDLIREGDKPEHVHVVLEGFAVRYKDLPDGGRQIMAYLVAGDMCDLHVHILDAVDHSIGTLTPCRLAYIPQRTVDELPLSKPRAPSFLAGGSAWLSAVGARDILPTMARA